MQHTSSSRIRAERRFARVVVAMSLALTGVVVVQVLWILRVQREEATQFRLAVTAALQATVSQMESAEARQQVRQLLEEEAFGDPLVAANATPSACPRHTGSAEWLRDATLPVEGEYAVVRSNAKERVLFAQPDPQHVEQFLRSGQPVTYFTDETGKAPACATSCHTGAARGAGSFALAEMPGEPGLSSDELTAIQLRKLRFRLDNLEHALAQLLDNPQPLSERVDSAQLARLLQYQLLQHGVSDTGNWWIAKAPTAELIGNAQPVALGLVPSQASLVGDRIFSAALYPNDLKPQGYRLYVTFPSRAGGTNSRVAGMALAAVGLVAVVVVGFVFTVRSHFRQKKLSEMKQDFVNNMTHEFKTPIATISLAAEALRDNAIGELPERRQRLAGVISQESARLESQVERVLQLAELERSGIELNPERVPIAHFVENVLENARLPVEAQGGSLHLRTEVPRTLAVVLDPLHITNVLTNLLDNAVKYTRQTPCITVTSSVTPTHWVLAVTDNGIGMNTEQQRRVFDTFYRVNTGYRHDVKGFGLGLAYVKQVAEAHRGSVEVASQPDEGSTFWVQIPLRGLKATAEEPAINLPA